MFGAPAAAQQTEAATSTSDDVVQLETIEVQTRNPNAVLGNLPPTYAGGEVARGGNLGVLGNRDYMDTPFVQNDYTEKLIRDQQDRTVTEVLSNDSSVRSDYSPYSFQDNVLIRGFPLNSRDFAFGGLYGITDPRRPETEGVERIEVLHGPAAFLFGFPPEGGIGGVVNLIPKRAGDEPLTRVTADYLSSANGGGAVDIGRRFGDGNAIGLRFNGFYHDGETPIGDLRLRDGGTTLGVDFEGDRVRLSLDLGYHHLDYQSETEPFNVQSGFQIPKPPKLDKNVQQPWEFTTVDHEFGVARMEFDIATNWTAFAAVGGSYLNETFLSTLPTIADAAGDLSFSQLTFKDRESQETAQLGVRGTVDTGPFRHSLTLSGTGYLTDNPYNYAIGNAFASNLYAPVLVPRPNEVGLFPRITAPQPAQFDSIAAADTITILKDRFDVILGVREQEVEEKGYDPTSALLTSSYDKSATTPLVAAVFKPMHWLSLYTSYAQGLSLGPTAPATAANANAIFAPIVSEQIEGGAKVDLGKLGGSLAFYQIGQPSGVIDGNTNIFSVNGEQRNRGIDLAVFGTPTEGVRLLSGLTLLDGVLTKTQDGTFDGKQAPGVPHVQVNLGADYDLPWVRGLTADARVIFTAKQFYDEANLQSIPAWTRLDLGARYVFTVEKTRYTARVSVENVTGNDYWASTGEGSLSLGMPRTVKFSLAGEF